MAKNYSSKEVIITFGNVILRELAPDTFVTISRDEQAWTKQIGASGEGARSKSNNNGGTVTVTLMQTSLSNDFLTAYAKLDETSNQGQAPLMVKDLLGTTLAASPGAWIQKLPDIEFGVELSTREWVFDTDQLEMLVGSNL